jgi:hypothetical protein
MLNDLNQLSMYYENNNIQYLGEIENKYITHSIIIDIIGKISLSVLGILRSIKVTSSELIAWYNFLKITDIWHEAIFKSSNYYVEHSINIYRTELKL